jgi:hypothetical protein
MRTDLRRLDKLYLDCVRRRILKAERFVAGVDQRQAERGMGQDRAG